MSQPISLVKTSYQARSSEWRTCSKAPRVSIAFRSAIALFLVFAVVGIFGCKKKEAEKKEQKITIKLAFPSEVASFISTAKELFSASKPRLMDGTVVDVEAIQLETIPALEKLSTGLVKPTVWIAPSQAIADHVSDNVVNLGGRPGECVPLFSTEVGIASRESDRLLLTRGESASLVQLLAPASADETNTIAKTALVLASPAHSSSGVLATALLQRLQQSKEVTIADIADRILDTAETDIDALSRIAKYEGSEILLGLTTSQAVTAFNAVSGSRLVFTPVSEARIATRYVICTSEAAWVQSPERTAAAQFKAYLQRPELVQTAQALGFDPADHMESERTLVHRKDLAALGEVWSALERPTSLMVVVDTSGSLNGDSCEYMQKDLRSFAQSLRTGQQPIQVGMTTFSSGIDRVILFTKDLSPIIQTIDSIRCRGSSAVFSSTLRAIEAFQEGTYEGTRKRLLLISDGYGSAMEGEPVSFVTRAGRSLIANKISMTLLGLVHQGSDLKDLPERTESVGGTVTKASLEQLGMTLELYRASLSERFTNPFLPK